MTWLRYASDVRPVTVKLSAWKGSAAHPDHDRAKSKTGGVMETLVDVHSDPGGANNNDGGEPMTVMDKMTKQQGIKHHGIKAKL